MIIFLYGQDTYRLQQKLREIVEYYKRVHRSGVNLKFFEQKNLNYQDFQEQFRQSPMFKEKKLVILKNIFPNQEFTTPFLKNSKKFTSSTDVIVFYQAGSVPSGHPLFKFLVKNAKSQEFGFLERRKLRNWIKKELEKLSTKADFQAIEKLINFVGNDLWQFSNEIKKLDTFKKGKKIELKDVELLVKPKIETDIFKTIDAISLKNKKLAINLIHKHLEKGDNPLYLLSMINFQFRNIFEVKDLMEKKKPLALSHLHPYLIEKSSWQARKFTLQELKKIYRKLFEVDYKIKTGKIEPQLGLDLLITEI